MKKKNAKRKVEGITLIALVVTIVVLLILAGVSVNAIFGDSGIITKAQILNNEQEVSVIREAMRLYYLNNEISYKDDNPVGEQFLQSKITDNNTLEAIVQYQSDAENTDQIHYDRLYSLDIKKLGISNVNNEYFMDIETRIVYINNGVKVSKGTIYVLEEREIFPVVLAVEEIEGGFKLIATADERNEQISSYHFYINNELYRTISTSQKSVSIEVTDKEFGEYSCSVKVNRTIGQSDRSLEVTAENYYIKGKKDMELFCDNVNSGNSYAGKTVKVVNNIDLAGSTTNRNWVPIGNITNSFQGTFEGNNYEIQNMYNVGITEDFQGLFGYINNATIQNIKIASGEIQGTRNVAGILGYANNSNIFHCQNTINVNSSQGLSGGIVGNTEGTGTIMECTNLGNITCTGYVEEVLQQSVIGGIVGNNVFSVKKCTNSGNIQASNLAGGICGTSRNNIEECINEANIVSNGGNINQDAQTGGIVGYIGNASIINCNNKGNVKASKKSVGGIVGNLHNSTSENCHNSGSIESGAGYVGGIVGLGLGSSSNIIRSSNYGKIVCTGNIGNETLDSFIGGIVGFNYGKVTMSWNEGEIESESASAAGIVGAALSDVTSCYNKGKITVIGGNINGDAAQGGIVGYIINGTIEGCYNRGELITTKNSVGGIVGIAHYNPTIKNSYNTGTVTGNANVGQIMGLNATDETNQQTVTIESCYYLGTTTSEQQRTEADMKTTDFINLIGGTTYWKLDSSNKNDGFVILQWQ